MDRYFPYIDFDDGSGYVAVTFYDINLKLTKARRINAFIMRDYLEGSCKIKGNDSTKARNAFITGNKFRLAMRVYEWGDSGTGTLIWEGTALIKSIFDFNRNTVELTEFETSDIYGKWLGYMNKDIVYTSAFYHSQGIYNFVSEGGETYGSQILTLNWNGTNFSLVGTPYSIPRTGKPRIASQSGGTAIYDNVTQSLTRYTTADSGLTWQPSTLGLRTELQNTEYSALAFHDNSTFLYYDEYLEEIRQYQQTASGWTYTGSTNVTDLGECAMCFLYSSGNILHALVSVEQKAIYLLTTGASTLISNKFNIGDIDSPDITLISSDGTTHDVAVVDGRTKQLRTYRFNSGWSQLGEQFTIKGMLAPSIELLGTNIVAVHDSYIGYIQAYTWDNVNFAWSKTGNSLSIGAGFYSGMTRFTTNRLAFVMGDAIELECYRADKLWGIINNVLQAEWRDENPSVYQDLGLDPTLSSEDFDIDTTYAVFIDLIENVYQDTSLEKNKTINTIDILTWIETMFNNFWWIDDDPSVFPVNLLVDYTIKFKQPNEFSSVGTEIDVSSQTEHLNIREYLEEILIEIETLAFNNEIQNDFVGTDVAYGRQMPNRLDNSISVTTDLLGKINQLRGLENSYQNSGIMIMRLEQDTNIGYSHKYVCPAGASILGSGNVRNMDMSKTYLFANYLNDYRYKDNGTIKYNGTDNAVQNTCKPIIKFPNVSVNLPNHINGYLSNLNWGGGVKSYITEAETDWTTGLTTFRSVKLDL